MRITTMFFGLALALAGCSQNQGHAAENQRKITHLSAEQQADVVDLVSRTHLHLSHFETVTGEMHTQTLIWVEGVDIPGTSERLARPFIHGQFIDNELVSEDILLCDAGVETVDVPEDSCVGIPDSQRVRIVNLLNSLFTVLVGDAREYLPNEGNHNNTRPENFPPPQSPGGDHEHVVIPAFFTSPFFNYWKWCGVC